VRTAEELRVELPALRSLGPHLERRVATVG
jgi:hypothetical protein